MRVEHSGDRSWHPSGRCWCLRKIRGRSDNPSLVRRYQPFLGRRVVILTGVARGRPVGSVGTVLGGSQSPEGRIRGFHAEGPAGAEELAGAEDIAGAVAIASVGVNIKAIIMNYNCYAWVLRRSDNIQRRVTSICIQRTPFPWHAMASIECHGSGGILQNSTEAMELDLVENWFKLLRKWPLEPSFWIQYLSKML